MRAPGLAARLPLARGSTRFLTASLGRDPPRGVSPSWQACILDVPSPAVWRPASVLRPFAAGGAWQTRRTALWTANRSMDQPGRGRLGKVVPPGSGTGPGVVGKGPLPRRTGKCNSFQLRGRPHDRSMCALGLRTQDRACCACACAVRASPHLGTVPRTGTISFIGLHPEDRVCR